MITGCTAVIGAGIAGLTVGRRLAEAQRDVVVFDKARGVGGRTSTRRYDATAFDHGAQYFTCRTGEFGHQVEDWCRRGVAAPWNAAVATLRSGSARLLEDDPPRYVGVPGMNALAKDLAAPLRVEVEARVARVERGARGWRLVMQEGGTLDGFAAVVVATPAPQAAPLLEAAPRLAELAEQAEMLPCHALMLTFESLLNVEFDGAFVEDSPLAWVARNASKPGRPEPESWVVHAHAGWSEEHLEDPLADVEAALLRAFAEAIGSELPALRHRTAHRWRFSRTAQPRVIPSLWDSDLHIGVCGDWTHADRVEGAFTSGARLARAMLGGVCLPRESASA